MQIRWTMLLAPVWGCLTLNAVAAEVPIHAITQSVSVVAPATGPTTWALLVGVSQYQSPQIASLKYPAIDVTAIRDALVDPKLGGVPASHILLLTNEQATASNINGSVVSFLKPKVQPGDRVIVFLAGHGVTKGFGADAKGFLLPTDVKGLSTVALESSAVDLRALSNQLGQLPASQFVVFVDACREDPTPGRGVKGNVLSDVLTEGVQVVPEDQTRHASSVTFFACSIGQRAFEDPTLKHGVFTYWILDAIKDAAVPQQPTGAVDMGRLSSYVTNKVEDWCKATSQSGDFEIEQTPEMVTREISQPVVLMNVKRKYDATPIEANPPKLIVDTYPEGAEVTINGKSVGSGTVTDLLASPGSYVVKAESPGYAPVERTVEAFPGYGEQVIVRLQPGARGVTVADPNDGSVPDLYKRALDAETRQQWEVAEPGYQATIQSNPQFAPAYERLSVLQRRQGRIGDAIGTLINLVSQITPTAHAYSLLSEDYSLYAVQGPGDSETDSAVKNGDFKLPKSEQDAGDLAKRAANAAVKIDSSSGEAQRALGLSLIASDNKGKNKRDALAALGKSVFLDPNDASNQYALGFGIRFFGQNIKDPDARTSELQRAVGALKQALALRPDYYEAHRELAYCYHLMDDTDNAMHEYEQANANRGKATDGDEVAGVNCALAVLDKEKASKSDGPTKDAYLAASDGYWSDAKEISPDLKKAMGVLRMAGLSTRLVDYLPPQLQQLMDLPNTIKDNVMDHIRLPF